MPIEKLADKTGSGWKAYVGATALLLYGVLLGVDASGVIDIPSMEGNYETAYELIGLGLVGFGIRHAVGRTNGK